MLNVNVVAVADSTGTVVPEIFTTLAWAGEKKFVPVIVNVVSGLPVTGPIDEIVGGPGVAFTVNDVELAALPFGLVTVIGPVVAPLGTAATNTVGLAEITFAYVPLNLTAWSPGVDVNPDPRIVT